MGRFLHFGAKPSCLNQICFVDFFAGFAEPLHSAGVTITEAVTSHSSITLLGGICPMTHCTTKFRWNRIALRCQTLEDRVTPTNTPLPDLGPGFYQGFQGGLYPNGSANPPAGHLADGLTISQNQIQPLNNSGQPDAANGRIVMISIGMSN